MIVEVESRHNITYTMTLILHFKVSPFKAKLNNTTKRAKSKLKIQIYNWN